MSSANSNQPPELPKKKSKKPLLFGCLGLVLVFMLSAVLGIIYVVNNAKDIGYNLGAYAAKEASKAVLVENGFSEKDAAYILEPADDLVTALKDGKMTVDDLEPVMKHLIEEKTLKLALSHAFKSKYLKEGKYSELTLETAKKELSRVVEGLLKKKIDFSQMEEIADIILIEDDQGNKTFKKELNLADLEKIIKLLRQAADNGNVENKLFTYDIVKEIHNEFQTTVDEAKSNAQVN